MNLFVSPDPVYNQLKAISECEAFLKSNVNNLIKLLLSTFVPKLYTKRHIDDRSECLRDNDFATFGLFYSSRNIIQFCI